MTERWVLSTTVLESLSGTTLFYPCSGADLKVPLEIFAPYVTDFWFVDCNYFLHESSVTRMFPYMRPAALQPPVLAGDERYALLETRIEGPPRWNPQYRDITPCILTETYAHRTSGREIRIHRRRTDQSRSGQRIHSHQIAGKPLFGHQRLANRCRCPRPIESLGKRGRIRSARWI